MNADDAVVFPHVNPWKFALETELSRLELKLVASVRHLNEFTPQQAAEYSRQASNACSVYLARLVTKGFVEKLDGGRFRLKPTLRWYLWARLDQRCTFEARIRDNKLKWVAQGTTPAGNTGFEGLKRAG